MAEDEVKIIFIEPEPQLSGFVVKVIGIGGGALNILNKLPSESIHELEYIAIDTDQDWLKNSKFAKTFYLNTSCVIKPSNALSATAQTVRVWAN